MAADRTPNALRRRNWKEPMSEHTGGTVTYHRAEYRPGTDEPWLVWFTEDQADPYWFTAEQGEAMGLTPPEPAPLVVTCNGHSIELSDEEARAFVQEWDLHGDREDFFMLSNHDLACDALAGLLRDARQDPQPTADTPSDDIDFDALPIGTVLRGKRTDSRYCVVKTNTSAWTWASDDVGDPVWTAPIEWRIVYQPAPLSPRQHLEALLAGRDDAAREMLSLPRTWSAAWMDVVAGAARGGA